MDTRAVCIPERFDCCRTSRLSPNRRIPITSRFCLCSSIMESAVPNLSVNRSPSKSAHPTRGNEFSTGVNST